MGGEKQNARENIDRFTKQLVESDRSLAKNPERAKEIAVNAQLRSEGERRPTEGNGRKR